MTPFGLIGCSLGAAGLLTGVWLLVASLRNPQDTDRVSPYEASLLIASSILPIAYYGVKAAYHSRSISLTTSVVIAVLTVLIVGGGIRMMKRFFPEENPEVQKA